MYLKNPVKFRNTAITQILSFGLLTEKWLQIECNPLEQGQRVSRATELDQC